MQRAPSAEQTAPAKKSNVKLNALREIEEKVQAKWEAEKVFEENAPETQA